MKTKVLVIAVIKKDSTVLMRKKPAGSPPYTETWYLFGGELTPGIAPEKAAQDIVRQQAGIEIRMTEQSSWDTEVKADLDGETKQFVYLDAIFEYVSGDLVIAPGIEKLEWAPIDNLSEYDLVPPSVELFKKLGYLL
ncbi:NUDIX domain-containing protein [Candidatus Saccharibacteria bacterium]|nr:NUDIX domain-containing protein [Candidatus Saccharibacteria bacterium]